MIRPAAPRLRSRVHQSFRRPRVQSKDRPKTASSYRQKETTRAPSNSRRKYGLGRSRPKTGGACAIQLRLDQSEGRRGSACSAVGSVRGPNARRLREQKEQLSSYRDQPTKHPLWKTRCSDGGQDGERPREAHPVRGESFLSI